MRVAFFDTECFPNFWLLKFRPIGEQSLSFSILAGQRFSDQQIAEIRALFDTHTVISFNGINYDVAMITGALCGYTPEQLKDINDRMIVHKVRYWDLGLPRWQPYDHIDLIEVAPGDGSLKQYAGRIHSKKIQDLPYEPDHILTESQMSEVALYCDNDLDVLEDLWNALQPQIEQRVALSERYGIDLRSKSDAQLAETLIKALCEKETGRTIYKQDIDYNMQFKYDVPAYIAYQTPQLQDALAKVKSATFRLSSSGYVEMPQELDELAIPIGQSVYRMGIGGLHSSESTSVHHSDKVNVLRDNDVAAYYPSLILNSGKYPKSLGPAFIPVFTGIKDRRIAGKRECQRLAKLNLKNTIEYTKAHVDNEGGKIQINGTFGKSGSPYSILFAPEMLIQTTITGQLCLLMLIEWHEAYGIPVVSANTDGIVIKCPKDKVAVSDALIAEWQTRTGLEMETVEYKSIYSRDVNNYLAVKSDGSVKRKGEYATSGLVEKKNPDVEICSDAVADFLAKDTPLLYTLAACRDIRKFVTIQKVTGGGVKLWGESPLKDTKVRDMLPVLLANGWIKDGRKWQRNGQVHDARTAYSLCFPVQRPEYLGKVVRWYYSTQAPGPIVYAKRNAIVSLSYGARPCMTLPDEFPTDIDYEWYLNKCLTILKDIGYSDDTVNKEITHDPATI